MSRIVTTLIFLLVFALVLPAQTGGDTIVTSVADTLFQEDSTIKEDSLEQLLMKDSVSRVPRKDNSWSWNSDIAFSIYNLQWQLMKRHPYFGFSATPATVHSDIRTVKGKEFLFYLLVAILLGYALLKQAFPKYFSDLFRLFFRTTLKQRQIKEQLMQTPLPSMLLNVFFVITGGLYSVFLLQHYKLEISGGFWVQFAWCCLGLSAIYLVKFLGLKFAGWLFHMMEAADNYIFIVFVVNKMLALLLLPFIILLAFTTGSVYDMAFMFSLFLVGGFLAYRIILTFAGIRNQVKVNPFHFFLYLCAFEIAPLLLLYKGLLLFFRITA